MFRFLTLAVCLSGLLPAQVPNTVKILDETAVPGGAVQLKAMLTSPQPVSIGRLAMRSNLRARVAGVAAFDSTGGTSGAAVITSTGLNVSLLSPKNTLGTTDDYPLLAVTLEVDPEAAPGEVSTVSLDAASFLKDALGHSVNLEFHPGTLTVGGKVAVNDVIPGGGVVPAGGIVRVLGMGFSPKTLVRIKEATAARTSFISSTEVQIQLASAFRLDGAEVQVRNPDGSSISYFSYLRGILDGHSTRALLNETDPIFSVTTLKEAIVPATLSQLNAAQFTGLALQNPGASTAAVTVEQYLGNQREGRVTFALAPRHRIVRDVAEWFNSRPLGAYWRVVSTEPIQILGLVGNTTTSSVLPVSVLLVQPGKFPGA